MNVLNVEDVERELRKFAVHAVHPKVNQWVMTVARNHMLGKMNERDADMNYRVYNPELWKQTPELTLAPPRHTDMPPPSRLPPWAVEALARGEVLHWFDPVQVRRRPIWQALDVVITWFNMWPRADTRLRRIDRISFDVAINGSAMWFQHLQANIWEYVKDKPPVIRKYEDGYHWVKLVTALHFEREGRLQNHCVGNGNYFNSWRNARTEYYSLRDKNNKPHVTIEVGLSGHPQTKCVLQCKGHSNQKPAPSYQRYIRRFFNDMNWTINGDCSNID